MQYKRTQEQSEAQQMQGMVPPLFHFLSTQDPHAEWHPKDRKFL